ncbi:trypsin-like serine peptidase [Microbispora hainanensis]|uniref:trypsin-like serine peptidase n=1 Tax=Microbispora hainanensis TaxID=568844 RepID=UPI0033CA2239
MKRILPPLWGAAATAALLVSGTAVPAHAYEITVTTPLVSGEKAADVIAYWLGDGGRPLTAATPFSAPAGIQATPVKAEGSTPGGVRGVVPASAGVKRASGPSRNVNLPRTTGKVFFVGSDGRPHWCAGTSVQSDHRNLVATAGHCVYAPRPAAGSTSEGTAAGTAAGTAQGAEDSTPAPYRYWIFIPGYAGGGTPWGVYVGARVFAHSDFTRYGDLDRDYAFVSVHAGLLPKRVTLRDAAQYAAFSAGPKYRTATGYTGVRLLPAGRLGDKVGGQGLAYNLPVDRPLAIFGYPTQTAEGHATGSTRLTRAYGRPFLAQDLSRRANELIAVRSAFTAASGSPWLAAYHGVRGLGYLNGLTIGLSGPGTGLSPYFDGELFQVYSAARRAG